MGYVAGSRAPRRNASKLADSAPSAANLARASRAASAGAFGGDAGFAAGASQAGGACFLASDGGPPPSHQGDSGDASAVSNADGFATCVQINQ